jgi:flagellar M-ring protein FliF
MSALLDGLKTLGTARLVALAAVGLAMMSLLTVLALRTPSEQMSLLYGELDLREASQIAELLDRQKLAHQISGNGSQILVPADQVARARLMLAKEGLPTGGSIGYEIFDRGDNLTASQFQQTINQSRALEGELSRTIRGIKGVKSVRVHLVLPKREPFARDHQDAQASVQLTMAGAGRLDNEGTSAIINLVAAAVPGLRPQNIAITDTRGNLLARAGEPIGQLVAVNNDELRRASEQRLARAIEEMLERSLGPGRTRAEASITFDYEQIRETQERYDPDGQVVRSSQSVTNSSKTTEQSTSVSVQNNLPNADAGTSPSGTQDQRQEETTNYEIAKTVRTVIRDQPKIARLSIAVMVDGMTSKGSDDALIWKERPPEELERITRLVKSAVGFDEKRGDKVEIVSLRFTTEPGPLDDQPHTSLPFQLEKSDLIHLSETALFGVLALVGLMVILRPMVARLTSAPPHLMVTDASETPSDVSSAGYNELGQSRSAAQLAGGTGLPAIAGPGTNSTAINSSSTAQLEDESMVNLANVEGQLRASSIRRIADLVEKHPEESLSIVRAWMQQEPA